MVVRVAAANLNFRRYLLLGSTGRFRRIGEITGVPFAALGDYVHSGDRNGIVGSITADADPRQPRWLNLKLILDCLAVTNATGYTRARSRLATVHRRTRKKRRPFAQLDLSFHDETGAPIEDYAFALGAMVRGKPRPSKTVKHLHKNQVDGSHLSVFLDPRHLEPQLDYFMEFNSDSGTDLYRYRPDPLRVSLPGEQLARIIRSDQTTQVQVILSREPDAKLFGFHRADDPDLHLRWNRRGEVVDRKLPVD